MAVFKYQKGWKTFLLSNCFCEDQNVDIFVLWKCGNATCTFNCEWNVTTLVNMRIHILSINYYVRLNVNIIVCCTLIIYPYNILCILYCLSMRLFVYSVFDIVSVLYGVSCHINCIHPYKESLWTKWVSVFVYIYSVHKCHLDVLSSFLYNLRWKHKCYKTEK